MPLHRRRASKEQHQVRGDEQKMDSGARSSSSTTTTVVETLPAEGEEVEATGSERTISRMRKPGIIQPIATLEDADTPAQTIRPQRLYDRKISPGRNVVTLDSRPVQAERAQRLYDRKISPGRRAFQPMEAHDDGQPRERKISNIRRDVDQSHHGGDADGHQQPRERKISRGLRKISSSISSMMINSHGHYYDGGHYPQQHESQLPGNSEGVGEEAAREKKVSRERKVSRVRKASDAITAMMVNSHGHYSQQYPQHQHLRDNHQQQIPHQHEVPQPQPPLQPADDDEKKERKISRSRKISQVITSTIVNIGHQAGFIVHPEDSLHHHQFHHPETLREDFREEKTTASGALADRRRSIDTARDLFQSPHYLPRFDSGDPERRSIASTIEEVSSIYPPEEFAGGKLWPQFIASIAANMGAFAFGNVLAWSATGLPSMVETDDLGEMSSSVSSWIGSIPTLGAVAACPFAGFALDTLGRRRSMLFLTVPFIIGWLFIGLAQNFFMVLFGRFVTGFCGGCFSIAAPIFTAETADARIRGGLGSLFDLLMSTGMLYIYVVGVFLSWRYQAIACAVIPIAFHVIMYFVPESPRYLIQRDKAHKAEKAIFWLRGNATHPDVVQKEIDDLKTSVGETQGGDVSVRKSIDRALVKPVAILIGIMFFATLSGIDAVMAYTVNIFESAGSTMDPKISTIIIGVVTMAASFPTAAIVDLAGRRILLMASELVMTVALALMGLYFYMMRTETSLFGAIEYQDVTWIPLAALVLFIIGYSLGCGPLSMMMIGELLPNKLKGLTSCIVVMTRWFLAFGVTNVFGNLKAAINDDGTYWMLACFCFVGTFFIYFCVPETKGKSLAEIQLYFEGHKQNNIAVAAAVAATQDDKNKRDVLGGLGAYDNKIVEEC